MNISELAIKRPVLATVANIILILFGIIGFTYLGVREYPAIDPPIISVATAYSGANAQIIESQITEPIEKAVNGIPGIKNIASSSSVGSSNITIEFTLESNLDNAANDVRDKVSQALRSLPQDLEAPPIVTKADANSDFIIIMAVQSPTKGLLELSDFAENVLQSKLQTIPEVSNVAIYGQKRPAMRIWLLPDRLNAYSIAVNDIITALNKENIEMPSGKIYGNSTELTIRTLGRFTTEDDFRNLIIKQDNKGIVKLGDVANVEIGPEQLEQNWKLNMLSGVGIGIIPQPGANYIKIADEFYKRLNEMNKTLGDEIKLKVLIDTTAKVRKSIKEVEETILIAFILVVIVIFFFFRDWLMALRPLIDIPISLIFTFFVMYMAGFSINMLTLLGIVLATGLVVDDGIVVTENIFRKIELGMPVKKAAIEGSKEIFFAVISTSVTLAIVFLPVIFMQGFLGSLFKEFAIVVGSAVLISAFVSLTITPVLNVILHKNNHGQGWLYTKTEPMFVGMESGYYQLLAWCIRRRWIAWIILALCILLIILLSKTLKSELAPLEDKSTIRFQIAGPEGASFDYMVNNGDKFLSYLIDSVPEREFVFGAIPNFFGTSLNSGFARIQLMPIAERNRSQSQIAKDLNMKVSKFSNLRIFAVEEQTIAVGLGTRGSLPVQYIIQNLDFDKIKNIIPQFMDSVRANKTFANSDVNLKFNKPQLDITIDRIKARSYGVNMADVSAVIQSAFSGRRIAYYMANDKQYPVIAQVALQNRQQPSDIVNLYVRNSSGENIALSNIISVLENASPPTIYHYNRYKSATISASLAEGKTIGDGVAAMQEIAGKVLDPSFQTSLSGPSRDYAESSSNIAFAFMLALALIYLVLAAQFESFRDPFVIMLTVPLALAGALFSLYIFGHTLNIFSQIGMIMLIGLVTKNGILIVDFANSIRTRGYSMYHAVIQASTQRLRPILMTSLATSLGALPIAINLGASSTSRIPLGIVIVGGIMFSLILTLIVIPIMYTYISVKKSKHK
ncbi:MAG: efflux RND transporter permease subunit [Cytophagales bacterium]|nr:efflux RND transporter permease subunit [Cytophagales bacterium]